MFLQCSCPSVDELNRQKIGPLTGRHSANRPAQLGEHTGMEKTGHYRRS